jgi:hypothetical protein
MAALSTSSPACVGTSANSPLALAPALTPTPIPFRRFFGKGIYDGLGDGTPLGLISNNWGGTPVEHVSQKKEPRAPKTHAPKKQTRTQTLPPPKP